VAYCEEADIQKQLDPVTLVQLTDDDADGSSDEGVIAAAIAEADATIDAMLSGQYVTPFTTPPELVKRLSVTLSVGNLYARRPHTDAGVWGDRVSRAERLLEKIATGKLSLGDAASGDENQDDVETNKTTEDLIFSGENTDFDY